MNADRVERRLAAILAADVAGYARLMGVDEEGTLAALKAVRRELADPQIAEYRGRIVKTTGDGLLVEFASVVDAMRCAVEVQREMVRRNANVPSERRIEFRVGIHQGDIIVEDGDIFGDGVNLAARLEGLAEPGGICVSARVRSDTVGKVDVDFEDMGEQQLKNIARPIHVFRARLGDAPSVAPERTALALPDKPSIAVLPFQNMSGDPEQEYFADGMVEEIITALAWIRWLFVIARNSSFTYKGQAVDVRRVGRELGVRYVLEGSVRKAAGRVRITAQLIEAETDAHLWADRFDGSLEDVFELQDEIAARVAGVIEPTLRAAEVERARRKRPDNLDAYDLYLRALPELRAFTAEGSTTALALLRRAIAIDPGYAAALAEAAFCFARRRNYQWTADEQAEAETAEGVRLARAAIAAARDDATVLATAGFALWMLNRDTEAAIRLLERPVVLNPNLATAQGYSGYIRAFAGDSAVAIERCARAMRLSPLDPATLAFLLGTGIAYLTERRLEEALVWLQRAHEERPTHPLVLALLVSAYAHLGRSDAAGDVLRQLPEAGQRTVAAWDRRFGIFTNTADREFLCEGLRRAGLAEA